MATAIADVPDAGDNIIIDGTFPTPEEASKMSKNVSNLIPASDVAGNVIIMEPNCDNDEAYKCFCNNDLQIAKNLRQSVFNANVLNVRKNKFKKFLIIDLKPCNGVTLDRLLAVKSFGSWEVSCRLPEIQTTSYGVIGPVGTDTPLEDFKDKILNN